MDVGLIRAVVDAMVTELEDNAELPDHQLVKYTRPRAILPGDCPLLCVYLEMKVAGPLTTRSFDGGLRIACSWHVEVVEEAQTLVDHEERAADMIDNAERIEARIRRLAVDGLAAGTDQPQQHAWQVTPAGIMPSPPEQETGLVEGVVVAAIVAIDELPPPT